MTEDKTSSSYTQIVYSLGLGKEKQDDPVIQVVLVDSDTPTGRAIMHVLLGSQLACWSYSIKQPLSREML